MASPSSSALTVYRIGDARHPIYDGGGAYVHGGRWNSPGRKVIYAASTYAGAMLERMILFSSRIPRPQVAIAIAIPDEVSRLKVEPAHVPDWATQDPIASRAYGDEWLESNRTCVLIVPSVVVRAENNLVINQEHPEFSLITASEPEPVIWDARLFRR